MENSPTPEAMLPQGINASHRGSRLACRPPTSETTTSHAAAGMMLALSSPYMNVSNNNSHSTCLYTRLSPSPYHASESYQFHSVCVPLKESEERFYNALYAPHTTCGLGRLALHEGDEESQATEEAEDHPQATRSANDRSDSAKASVGYSSAGEGSWGGPHISPVRVEMHTPVRQLTLHQLSGAPAERATVFIEETSHVWGLDDKEDAQCTPTVRLQVCGGAPAPRVAIAASLEEELVDATPCAGPHSSQRCNHRSHVSSGVENAYAFDYDRHRSCTTPRPCAEEFKPDVVPNASCNGFREADAPSALCFDEALACVEALGYDRRRAEASSTRHSQEMTLSHGDFTCEALAHLLAVLDVRDRENHPTDATHNNIISFHAADESGRRGRVTTATEEDDGLHHGSPRQYIRRIFEKYRATPPQAAVSGSRRHRGDGNWDYRQTCLQLLHGINRERGERMRQRTLEALGAASYHPIRTARW